MTAKITLRRKQNANFTPGNKGVLSRQETEIKEVWKEVKKLNDREKRVANVNQICQIVKETYAKVLKKVALVIIKPKD